MELNHLPPRYQRGTLTDELHAHVYYVFFFLLFFQGSFPLFFETPAPAHPPWDLATCGW